jgi:outer membrane lipoprotein SlyB
MKQKIIVIAITALSFHACKNADTDSTTTSDQSTTTSTNESTNGSTNGSTNANGNNTAQAYLPLMKMLLMLI